MSDRRRDSQEHRVQSGRGFWLQTGCIVKTLSCGEADGGFWVGLGKRGRERMVRHQAAERGSVGKRLKKEDGRTAGTANFYRR